MSVTFMVRQDEVETVVDACICTDAGGAGVDGCPWCHGTGTVTSRFDRHAVNVANMNAGVILRGLGVRFDYVGSLDAQSLYTRALVASWTTDDEYLKRRYTALVELASYAIRTGQPEVHWS